MKTTATVTRQAMGGMTVVTVSIGHMQARCINYGSEMGTWNVTIGRRTISRVSAGDLRTCGLLRGRMYATVLKAVEAGRA